MSWTSMQASASNANSRVPASRYGSTGASHRLDMVTFSSSLASIFPGSLLVDVEMTLF